MMAGRGRGRGFRTGFGFDPERRETLQQLPPNQQPTPLYPVMEQKPLPLVGGEQVDYLLALKQELRGASRSLPSFLQPTLKRRDVQRYSDKYHQEPDQDQDWTPDWSRFPKELRMRSQKPRPSGLRATSRRSQTPKKQTSKTDEKQDVLQKLESLEQKEKHSDEEEEEKKAEEEDAEEEQQQLDEEEFEEETDYIMSYFDNGEDFGADSDDNMDEAIY